MGKGGRKSVAASSDGSLNPDLDLKDTIRQRKQRMLKSAMQSVLRLEETDNVSTVRILKTEMDSMWTEFMHAFEDQEAILIGIGDANLSELTNEFVSMHNMYVKAKIHASNLITPSNAANATVENEQSQNTSSTDQNRPSFKMAPMRISPFSGELSDWIEFKATCDLILDSNIKEAQRFSRMLYSVKLVNW